MTGKQDTKIHTWKELFSLKGLVGIGVGALAFTYILQTVDLIPDAIPVVGFVDDAAIVVVAFLVGKHIYTLLKRKAQ